MPIDTHAAEPVTILYTNWRGETAPRKIVVDVGFPKCRTWFGATEWHPEPQWLFRALDVEKGENRDFAFSGIKAWGAEAVAPATAPPAPEALADQTALIDAGMRALESCSEEETSAFEAWAAGAGYDMHEHPLHYLFMDAKTDTARQGWKAALRFASRTLIASPPAASAPPGLARSEGAGDSVPLPYPLPKPGISPLDTALSNAEGLTEASDALNYLTAMAGIAWNDLYGDMEDAPDKVSACHKIVEAALSGRLAASAPLVDGGGRERIAEIIEPEARAAWTRRFEFQKTTVGQEEAHAARTATYYHPEWPAAIDRHATPDGEGTAPGHIAKPGGPHVIIEACDTTATGWALTIQWPDGTETVETVSDNAARVLGYRSEEAGGEEEPATPQGAVDR